MSIRAGALLAGVATACAIPAVALGQIDPGQVGNTVTGVTKQVPQVPQPFTGYALIAVGLLGLIALVTGFGLRGASRLRFARRRA